jgi:hypothetical protein
VRRSKGAIRRLAKYPEKGLRTASNINEKASSAICYFLFAIGGASGESNTLNTLYIMVVPTNRSSFGSRA